MKSKMIKYSFSLFIGKTKNLLSNSSGNGNVCSRSSLTPQIVDMDEVEILWNRREEVKMSLFLSKDYNTI